MADDIIYIDVEAGSKRVMNNITLYAKLLVKFKNDQSFNEVNAAFKEGNIEKAQNASHALKGLAANLSLTELFNQSIELEKQIKDGSLNPEQIAIVNNVYAQTIIEVDKVIAQYA